MAAFLFFFLAIIFFPITVFLLAILLCGTCMTPRDVAGEALICAVGGFRAGFMSPTRLSTVLYKYYRSKNSKRSETKVLVVKDTSRRLGSRLGRWLASSDRDSALTVTGGDFQAVRAPSNTASSVLWVSKLEASSPDLETTLTILAARNADAGNADAGTAGIRLILRVSGFERESGNGIDESGEGENGKG
ncbi:hypothetical protein PspLS_08716 [Pyricularia sp. CBS 133598]|nr:hypothetical protein PspLS_08716 [Pyricularia sp. CBS 133598]